MRRLAALTLLAALGAAVLSAGPAPADSRQQLLATVSKELRFFVPDVDPDTLTTAQLARINGVLHRDLSQSDKAGMIRSILGGRHSLRGLLFN